MVKVAVLRPQEAFQQGKIVMQKDSFDIKSLKVTVPLLEYTCWHCCITTKLMQTEFDVPQSMWQFFSAKVLGPC